MTVSTRRLRDAHFRRQFNARALHALFLDDVVERVAHDTGYNREAVKKMLESFGWCAANLLLEGVPVSLPYIGVLHTKRTYSKKDSKYKGLYPRVKWATTFRVLVTLSGLYTGEIDVKRVQQARERQAVARRGHILHRSAIIRRIIAARKAKFRRRREHFNPRPEDRPALGTFSPDRPKVSRADPRLTREVRASYEELGLLSRDERDPVTVEDDDSEIEIEIEDED